jgi:hypothetical protein
MVTQSSNFTNIKKVVGHCYLHTISYSLKVSIRRCLSVANREFNICIHQYDILKQQLDLEQTHEVTTRPSNIWK